MRENGEKKKSHNCMGWNCKGAILDVLEYIALESPQGAKIVESAILEAIDFLPGHPEMHPPDGLKTNNDSTFRAFTVFHYRVTYKIEPENIIILRVRHTSRDPLQY